MSADLSSLIAKLESAESGSRELDAEIARAVGSCSEHDIGDGWMLSYTTSIDDALTLVPDGWGTDVHMSPPAHNCEQSAVLVRGEPPFFDDEEIDAHAATAVLALCIAALKARKNG